MPVAGQVDFVPSVGCVNLCWVGIRIVQGKKLTWVNGYELPGLYAAGDVEMVPDLI